MDNNWISYVQYRERIIFIGDNIDEEFSNQVLASMLYLDSIDNTKKILLYINGPGGDVRTLQWHACAYVVLLFFYFTIISLSGAGGHDFVTCKQCYRQEFGIEVSAQNHQTLDCWFHTVQIFVLMLQYEGKNFDKKLHENQVTLNQQITRVAF